MGLRTREEFLSGIADGREVYYRGDRVKDITQHPELGVAARHAAIDFEMAENPAFRELAVFTEDDQEYSATTGSRSQRRTCEPGRGSLKLPL